MNNQPYALALTLRKTRKPVTLPYYKEQLKLIGQHVDIYNVNYEDTKGLHVHCIIESDEFVDLKAIIPPHGWNYKVVPLYNRVGWIKYSEKDKDKHVLQNHFNEQINEELYEENPSVTSEERYTLEDYLFSATEPKKGEYPDNCKEYYDGISNLIKKIGCRRL